jgi:hypothetical protein
VALSYINLLKKAYGAVIGSYFLADNPGVYVAPQNNQNKKIDNKETGSEDKDVNWFE